MDVKLGLLDGNHACFAVIDRSDDGKNRADSISHIFDSQEKSLRIQYRQFLRGRLDGLAAFSSSDLDDPTPHGQPVAGCLAGLAS